jgi:hypothetical protein
LRLRAARVDLVGAGEEAGRCLRIAKLDRRLAGTDEGFEILGIGRERADVSGERGRRAFVIWRLAALRGQRRGRERTSARDNGSAQPKVQQSPHRPSPVRHRILPEPFCLEGLR